MTVRAPGQGGLGHSEVVNAQRECQRQEGPGAFLQMPLGHLPTPHRPGQGQGSGLHSAHREDLQTGAPWPAPSQFRQTLGRQDLVLEKFLNPSLRGSNV